MHQIEQEEAITAAMEVAVQEDTFLRPHDRTIYHEQLSMGNKNNPLALHVMYSAGSGSLLPQMCRKSCFSWELGLVSINR
jgi:hypothetical protein